MSKVYTHSTNKHPAQDISFSFFLAIVFTFLFALSTIAKADVGYDCHIQEDSTCLIYLDEVLEVNATIDDALAYCDNVNGEYVPEYDICHIK